MSDRCPKLPVGPLRLLRYKRYAVRFILIAAKQLEFAKTRLAPVLPPGERRSLAEAMFRDVLAASLGATAADHVSVVTSDAGLLAMARAAGALLIDEEYPRGLNVAVALGTSALIAQGARTVCTVLSDIPLVEAAGNVVPVAVTAGESVERLRSWAAGRCLAADRPGLYTRVTEPSGKAGRAVRRDPSAN